MIKIVVFECFLIFSLYAQEIVNGNFEEVDSNKNFVGWVTKHKPQGSYKTIINEVNSEKYLVVESIKDSLSKWVSTSQTLKSITDSPTLIRLSAKVKTEIFDTKSKFRISLYVKNKGKTIRQHNYIYKDQDWTEISVRAIQDASVDSIIVRITLLGKGKVNVDSIKLEEMDLASNAVDESLKNYYQAAFDTIKTHSYKNNELNWDEIYNKSSKFLSTTRTYKDIYTIINYLLFLVNDNHSSFIHPETFKSWKDFSPTSSNKVTYPFSERLFGDIGYIRIPRFSSGDSSQSLVFADTLHFMIKSLKDNIKGWIIDFRQNNGGNMWPMVTGVGPLLGDGEFGVFTGSSNKSICKYIKGKSMVENDIILSVSDTTFQLPDLSKPIAILIDKRTASSGEMTALAFKGKNNTKFFGEPSGGYTTSNSMYLLADSAVINLSNGYFADRNENKYIPNIVPDTLISGFDFDNLENDNAVKGAKDWIYNYNN